jgi:hypothetical protein
MVKIHKLKQPNKRSGHKLAPGKTTEIRGMVITNKNKFEVYVDRFTRKPWKPKKKATTTKVSEGEVNESI